MNLGKHTYPILRSPSLLSAANNTEVVRRTDILVGSSMPLPDNRQVHNENNLFNLQDSCAYYGNMMLEREIMYNICQHEYGNAQPQG